jgi:phthalate 4,5-dioxygenase
MSTRGQNDFLTQTGPGTPVGNLLRRYWIPALLSAEVPEPDCAPVRVKVLSERLLAFRDTQGRVGVIDEFCAHRGVSLWFGRNEENGLRCAYHGWKYDVSGQCTEVPSEPEASGFCKKIKLTSYPCVELGDVIWIYMGPAEHKPPLPAFEWAKVPHSHRSCRNAPRSATTCRRWRAESIRRMSRFFIATNCAATRSMWARAPS